MKTACKVISCLLTLCLFVAVVGCAQTPQTGGQSTAGESAPAASGTTEAASPAGGTISFLDVNPSPEHTEVLKSIFTKFEEKNSGVKVEYTSVPWDQATEKVMAMIAAKSLPDINTMSSTEMAEMGAVIPLNEYWGKMPYKDDLTSAIKSFEPVMSHKGSIFKIPDGNIFRGVFIRTDWLEEAGIDIETLRNWTWDQYFEVVEKLTDKSKNRYGVAFRGGPDGINGFNEYICSMLGVTHPYPNNDRNSFMSNPESVALWEKYSSIYKNGYTPKESITWGFKEMVEGFTTGQCGTLIQTPEVVLTCEESMEPSTWTVLPFPVNKDASVHPLTWGAVSWFSISATAKDPDLAWSLIEYVISPESNLEYSKKFGVFPLYNSLLSDPFFQEGSYKGYADALMDPKIQYLTTPHILTEWTSYESNELRQMIQANLSGELSSEDLCKSYDEFLLRMYDQDIAPAQ